MYPFVQYTFAIIALIFAFLFIALVLPPLVDMWQGWIDDQRKRREQKTKCPQ